MGKMFCNKIAEEQKHNIKKIASIISLAVVICLSCAFISSCTEESEPINVDIIALSDYILTEAALDDFIIIPSEKMQNDYNINEENAKQAAVMVSLNINSSEEIVFVEAAGIEEHKAITDTLNQRKVDTLNALKDYTLNPDNERQYYIVEDSEVVTKDKYIFWVVHENSDEINKLIDRYIETNKVQ